MLWREKVGVVGLAVLAALLIAASNVSQTGELTLPGVYAYWLVRILIEAGLFVLVRDAIEQHQTAPRPLWLTTGAAILISLVPFVLAITALDIVLGFPELGMESSESVAASKLREFGLELVYLLDNHLFLCLLLSVPRLVAGQREQGHAIEVSTAGPNGLASASRATILTEMDPPLKGDVMWAEAQEHYVRLTTSEETRMVLIRFSDVLRDLPKDTGVRVHRSHWVALSAVSGAFKEGTNLRLKLQTGDIVPVSRSYRSDTERALQKAEVIPV
ncbi:MAG: LytTR family DNA-binding domain-containing protein [Hyphomicrobiaceae bacterium]